MGWFTGIAIYVLIWWTALFAVLPWGVRSRDVPENGNMGGAPENPHILRKCLVTTAISAIIWIIVIWLLKADLIDFYGISAAMMEEDTRS